MKKSRFSDSQIMEVLKRADAGVKVPDLCRELGVSSATFCKWRAEYAAKEYKKLMLECASIRHCGQQRLVRQRHFSVLPPAKFIASQTMCAASITATTI